MRYIFLILFLLYTSVCQAAAPARQSSYVSGSIISSSAVTANEDAIFNYLTAGVEVYADGTIVNADVNSSANIQSDKLNLTSIAQGVSITSGGSLTNAGTTTLSGALDASGTSTLTGTFAANGTTNSIGNGGSDALTLNVPGGMTLSAATTWTLTGALTFSGTIANLGSVTTADINGGTMDGVQVGGTTATGELIVNDASDDADGLGSQGTSGQFLQSTGAGANPTWAVTPFVPNNIQVFTSNGTWTKPASVSQVYVKVWGGGGGGSNRVSANNGGGGGGGGGYSEGLIAVTGDVTVTVGAAGVANTSSGGTSSFAGSTTIQATGGTTPTDSASGGSGGVGSNGTINLTGGSGGNGGVSSTTASFGGIGGGSPLGGSGGQGAPIAASASIGTRPGGAGGGAHGDGSGVPANGSLGLVIVYY